MITAKSVEPLSYADRVVAHAYMSIKPVNMWCSSDPSSKLLVDTLVKKADDAKSHRLDHRGAQGSKRGEHA